MENKRMKYTNIYQDESKSFLEERRSFWNKINLLPIKYLAKNYQKNIVRILRNYIPINSSILEIGCSSGNLLASLKPSYGVGIDFSKSAIQIAKEKNKNLDFYLIDGHQITIPKKKFDYIILSDLINDLWDIQKVLEEIRPFTKPETRIIINFFNNIWLLPISLARKFGFLKKTLLQNWVTLNDLENLLVLTQFEKIKSNQEILLPFNIPFISNFANLFLSKIFLFRQFSITNFVICRSVASHENYKPTVSVIIAARNEAGNIKELIERIPKMGQETEIIFIEGNSTDNTYNVIKKEIRNFPKKNCKLFKQSGKGKGDAVRLGFEKAKGDILMILDADITVPPEELIRFYKPLEDGVAEFVNGVRLVYPMENNAMQFLNLIGNKFFSYAFSWLLGQKIRDTLCGTKVLWRSDYKRIAANRGHFGDFDPFGDFDLLFGAAYLNLKIIEVPVRYRARKYGETNISRWKHGWLLLKMVVFAARRIKFV
jgi:ubiquinone/menaquinone biosynthesis C-methylase UbiE